MSSYCSLRYIALIIVLIQEFWLVISKQCGKGHTEDSPMRCTSRRFSVISSCECTWGWGYIIAFTSATELAGWNED